MPKHSARWAFLWQLIAKNRKRRLALHTALRTVYQRRQLEVSSNTEHLLRIGNSHLKHLYLSFVSWNTKKKHFHRAVPCQPRLLIACHYRSRNCLSLYSACSSGGGGIAFGRCSWYSCDVCAVHHMWINYFVIYMIYELIRQGVKRVLPSHYPTWQAELVLESHHSCAYFKINGVQRIRLRFDVCPKP